VLLEHRVLRDKMVQLEIQVPQGNKVRKVILDPGVKRVPLGKLDLLVQMVQLEKMAYMEKLVAEV
jgi:hypothetical protein